MSSFQKQVDDWIMACFGRVIRNDRSERNHRLLEETLELVQAAGCTASEAHQLVDYVYGRPAGELQQEVGGVMNTLAAFCNAHEVDMDQCGQTELSRVWGKIEQIRAKQAAKPKHSPLPGAAAGICLALLLGACDMPAGIAANLVGQAAIGSGEIAVMAAAKRKTQKPGTLPVPPHFVPPPAAPFQPNAGPGLSRPALQAADPLLAALTRPAGAELAGDGRGGTSYHPGVPR